MKGWLRASKDRKHRRSIGGHAQGRFESLEDRSLLAELTVTNTDDSGPGSLRQAIIDSNASIGIRDTIAFNISGAGTHTIQPLSQLDSIRDPADVDGTTQPGFAGAPLIELTGGGTLTFGLILNAGDVSVR